jgi:hypothetical protein
VSTSNDSFDERSVSRAINESKLNARREGVSCPRRYESLRHVGKERAEAKVYRDAPLLGLRALVETGSA